MSGEINETENEEGWYERKKRKLLWRNLFTFSDAARCEDYTLGCHIQYLKWAEEVVVHNQRMKCFSDTEKKLLKIEKYKIWRQTITLSLSLFLSLLSLFSLSVWLPLFLPISIFRPPSLSLCVFHSSFPLYSPPCLSFCFTSSLAITLSHHHSFYRSQYFKGDGDPSCTCRSGCPSTPCCHYIS